MKKFIAVSAVALGAALASSPALAAPAPYNPIASAGVIYWQDANGDLNVDTAELFTRTGAAGSYVYTPIVVSSANSANSANTVVAGAYNGSYANLAATSQALTTSLAGVQANITKYKAALAKPSTAATANAVADLQTLAAIRLARSVYSQAVTAGGQAPTAPQQLAINAALAGYTAVLGSAKFNNTTLQTDLTTNGIAFDALSQTVGGVEAALLTQVTVTDTAYVAALTDAGIANVASIQSAASFAAALNGVQSTLTTAQTSAATYQSQLTAVSRSTTLLAAGAASKSAYVKNAAAALSSPTAGVNYETEVLGALADHDTRIVSLEALTSEHTRQIADLNGRVDRLDEKVASSTATAIAMGGGAFLPDMKFNLSANVATYDGAQAIAASLGYRVSDNFAVTASVGGGLNKGGKVGGRVGFIFGW